MNKKIAIPIVIGIVISVGIVFSINQENDSVEDVLDIELTPTHDVTPEVQEKLNTIEKINSENQYVPKEREWITSGPFQIDRSEYILGEKIFLK